MLPPFFCLNLKLAFENINLIESFIVWKFKERLFLNEVGFKNFVIEKFLAFKLIFKRLSKSLIFSISYYQVLTFFKNSLNKASHRFETAIGNIMDLMTLFSFNKFILTAGSNKIIRNSIKHFYAFTALFFSFKFLPSIYGVSYFENFLSSLYVDLNFRLSLVLSNFTGDFLIKTV